MNDLFDYVFVENIYTENLCKEIIDKLNQNQWKDHRWYGTQQKWVNKKDFSVSYNIELQSLMKDNILKVCGKYFEKYNESFCTEYSGIRFNRYDEGESIASHVDHIHSLFNDKKGIPVLSMVGLLNDDFEGGEFMLCDQKVDLKAGDVLIFPSIFLYPHEVKPVTKGSRYSWVLWGY